MNRPKPCIMDSETHLGCLKIEMGMCNQRGNNLTTILWFGTKFSAAIHDPQRMKPNDLSDAVRFHVAPPVVHSKISKKS